MRHHHGRDVRYQLCEMRYMFWDPVLNVRACPDEDIKKFRGRTSAYNSSFRVLSQSQPEFHRSKCLIIERGWKPSDHFYISAGRADRYTALTEEEYLSQFLNGDDSDYDLLKYQPILDESTVERAQRNEIGRVQLGEFG